MSGARRMQELKYFRDGATVVISLDGLDWLLKRRQSDKRVKKRDEELQLLMSSGQMIQADEELQPITCLCVLDQRGSAAPQLWRNRSSLLTQPPLSSVAPRHRRPPEEPAHHFTSSPLASFVSECPKEAPWTRLILNLQDLFSLIKRGLDIVTQQDVVTVDNRFIIFCDEDIPRQRFGDFCCTEDCGTSIEGTDWHITDNSSTAQWPRGPKSNNSEGIQHELVTRDTCNLKSLLRSCQIYEATGASSARRENARKRKRVSFDDDVIFYLFDQESPTLELHSGPCTSSCNLPDATLEDIGLEWEDDFSALENNCHFQCSVSQCTCSLPQTRSFFPALSQTCLFLTHVTESDLEP